MKKLKNFWQILDIWLKVVYNVYKEVINMDDDLMLYDIDEDMMTDIEKEILYDEMIEGGEDFDY